MTNPDPQPGQSEHLNRLSRVYSPETWELYDQLDQSLEPRDPDWLLTKAAEYLTPGANVLDAGCRDGTHLIALVRANGVSGVGIEPVALHVERARAAVKTVGLEGRISIVHGTLEACDLPDGHFDFIWCRDVLEQVEPLVAFLQQAARVLTVGGRMLVFTVVATDLLSSSDRAMLSRHMGSLEANLSEANLTAAFETAGLRIEEKDVIGTEWREFAEERTQPVSRALLRLARLRRQRESVIASRGEDIYRHVEANLHWEVFQLLGKLQPIVFVLQHR